MTTTLLPESGKFTVSAWATALGMRPVTVREYIQKYSIPVRGRLIDAADWWNMLARASTRQQRTAVLYEVVDISDGVTVHGPTSRAEAIGYRDIRNTLRRRCKVVRGTWVRND